MQSEINNLVTKINDIRETLPEINEFEITRNANIYGRKNFISELRFLNKVINTIASVKQYVIYVGKCYHLYELSRYYPNVTFIVIHHEDQEIYTDINFKYADENKYVYKLKDVESLSKLLNGKTRIYQLKEECSVGLFITIRDLIPNGLMYLCSNLDMTGLDSYNNKDNFQKELREEAFNGSHILDNLSKQLLWVTSFNFEASMINFKFPELNDGKILTELQYIDGKMYLEPWSSNVNTETKMIIRKTSQPVIIKRDEYIGRINHYNANERIAWKQHKKKFGYCGCNDCAIELDAFKKYLNHNLDHIMTEFNIPKKYTNKMVIGLLSKRLSILTYSITSFEGHSIAQV